jgi:importin subunit alpha-1
MQLDAVAGFRKLLSIEHQPPIDEVIASGAVPYFIHFLQQQAMPQVLYRALRVK